MTIYYLLAGMTLGLSAGFSPGPLFALVISQTLRHGLEEGVKAAFAPLITDLPIIVISTLVLSTIYTYKPFLGLLSILGALFVVFLGYENLKIKEVDEKLAAEETNSVVKGAAVNALSPHPYLFWLAVGSPMILNAYAHGLMPASVFILSFYVSLVGAKVVLAVIVNKSRDFLAGKSYVYTMKGLGLLLIGFALFLLKDGVSLLLI